jgi:N-acetylglutamate synthase-like GNAT family acetyltransferase
VTDPHLEIRRVDPHDEEWVRERMRSPGGDEIVVSRGRVHRPASLPGFVVVADLIEPVGLLTYSLEDEQCQIVTIDSWREGTGVGSMLIDAVIHLARDVGCRRVWLVTTNDNVQVRRWCEARGFRLEAVHGGAMAASRKLKPSIPLVGQGGVPIADELEFGYAIG